MKRSFVAAAMAVVLTVTMADAAVAQLGKLKKAAGDKAAQAAGVPTKQPKMVDRIDLTVADLQALEKGVAAEVAAAPGIMKQAEQDQKDRQKAQDQYTKDYDAYLKASERWSTCREKLVQKEQPQEDALLKKQEADAKKADVSESEQAALEARGVKAQEAAARIAAGKGTPEDQKTLQEFQQVAAGLGQRGTAAIASGQELTEFKQGQAGRITQTCGQEPQSPKSPAGGAGMASDAFKETGSKAAGMDVRSYTIKREHLIAYCGSAVMVAPGSANAEELNNGLKAACPHVNEMMKAGVPI